MVNENVIDQYCFGCGAWEIYFEYWRRKVSKMWYNNWDWFRWTSEKCSEENMEGIEDDALTESRDDYWQNVSTSCVW